MPQPKPAKVTAFCVEIECPYCGAIIPDKSTGSEFHEVNSSALKRGARLECAECGKECTIPARTSAVRFS